MKRKEAKMICRMPILGSYHMGELWDKVIDRLYDRPSIRNRKFSCNKIILNIYKYQYAIHLV